MKIGVDMRLAENNGNVTEVYKL